MKNFKQLLILAVLAIFGFGQMWATTYQHIFNAKPSTGNNVTLSSVKWNIEATNLGNYNSANYAGVQLGASSKNGSISLTSASAWGGETGTYKDKTVITEVRLWLNLGGTSVTPTVTIGGKSATSDGTTVVKNSSAGSDYKKATKVTFTPAAHGNTGVVVISVSTVKAGYICAMEIDCEEEGGAKAPTITTNPVSANYTVGDNATNLSVAATASSGSLSYQWYSNTANSTTTPTPTALANCTTATYKPSTTSAGTTYYFCKVTDSKGSTNSGIATIKVSAPTGTFNKFTGDLVEGDYVFSNDKYCIQ